MRLVVREKKTNELYIHIDKAKFENIHTGKKGLINETNSDRFVINTEITQLIHLNPVIKDLISKLQLKIVK